jgi:hypothetical protein
MKCGICGEEHKSINYLHLRRHNLDYATYVALYPNNAGHDESVKENIRSGGIGISHGKGRKNPWKGKTYEERYGIEKAQLVKLSQSQKMSGRPSYRKGLKAVDEYGEERALEVGNKISNSRKITLAEHPEIIEQQRTSLIEHYKKEPNWITGLTKETDKRVAKIANQWRNPNSKYNAPDYWDRVMKSKGAKPNKLEVYFRDLLANYFGDSWQFVGDMTFRLYDDNMNFRNPDFKHKVLKKLIEIFNVYDKIKHYGSLKIYKQVTTRHYNKCGYEVKYFTDKEVYRHTDRVLAEVAIFEGVGVLC